MDFDEIVVKDSPGLCRCCLSEGCYKDLSTEYTWMGDNEVYADMLLECFDISITQHSDGPNGPNRLICEVCITRLRDACNFKKQVLESEKKFVDMLGRGDFKPKAVIIYQAGTLKTEPDSEPLPGPSEEEVDAEYLDEDLDFGDDEFRPDETLESLEEEDITVSTLPVKGKRGRKSKAVKSEKKSKITKISTDEAKASKSKDITSEDDNVTEDNNTKTLRLQRYYLSEVLKRTTAEPFRFLGGRFTCFYCSKNFYHWYELNDHVKTHDKRDDATVRKRLEASKSYHPLLLNINEATCKLCPEEFKEVDQFVDHLKEKHKMKYDDNYRDIFVLFNMRDKVNICCYCDTEFNEFHKLYKHIIQVHETKGQSVCYICGVSTRGSTWLRHHIKGAHGNQDYPCNECDKVFQTYHKHRYHYLTVHKEKSVKCGYCTEKFSDGASKRTHERSVHKVGCLTCNECGKKYTTNVILKRHKRRQHANHLEVLEQKNVICPVCGKTFYAKHGLKSHSVIHSDEKPFKCKYCEKSFKVKKGKMMHERIHENDRRCVCKICNAAFIQHTSLNIHMKKHKEVTK